MSNIYREWVCEVTQKIEDNVNKGAWIIDVSATKGEETMARNFHGIISQAMLTQAVKGWIDTVESAKAVTTEVDLTTPVVEEPTPPTQAELDRQAWEKDKNTLRQLQDLVDMGVFTGTETQIVNLRTRVKNNFKVEYLG
jgi:regulatory protein YycI of two-component signal transduction system YycFG